MNPLNNIGRLTYTMFVLLTVVAASSLGHVPAAQPHSAYADASITVTVPKALSCCDVSTNRMYALFEKSHPNVKLVTVNINPNNLTAALIAGNAPDLIQVDPGTAKTYFKAGYTLALNQYYQQFGWDKKFFKAESSAFLVNGQYSGIPYDLEGIILLYNQAMFQKNGWQVPTDYNHLVSLSQTMQKQGIMPFAYGDSDCQACDEFWISTIVNTVLGVQGAKQLWSGNISWTDPRVEAGLTRFVNYYQQGYITAKKSFAVSSSGANTLFFRQKAAMQINGTWTLGTYPPSPKAPFPVGYAYFPSWLPSFNGKPVIPLGTGGGWEINAKAKHPELVAALLNEFFNPQVQLDMVNQGAPEPTNVDYTKVKVPQTMQSGLNLMTDANKFGNAGYVDYAWASPSVVTQLETNVAALYLGKTSVAAWCAQTEAGKLKDAKAGTLVPLADFS